MLTIDSSHSASPIVPDSSESPAARPISAAQQVIQDALEHIKQAIDQKKFTFAEQRLEILLLEPCWRLSPLEHKNILSYLHRVGALPTADRALSNKTQALEQKLLKELKPEVAPTTMTGEVKKLYDRANSRTDDLNPTDQIHFYQAAGDNYRQNQAYLESVLAYTEGIWIAEYGSFSESTLSQALWAGLSVLEPPMLLTMQKSWFREQGDIILTSVKEKIAQLNITLAKELRDVQRYPHLIDFFKQIKILLAPLGGFEHLPLLADCYAVLTPHLQQWVEVLQTVLSSETAAGFSARFDEVKPLLSCWMIHRWHPLAAETVLKSCDNFLTAGNKVKAANEPIFIELLQYSNLMSSALLHPEPQTLLPEPRPIAISTPLHAKTLVEARKLFIREKEHPNASAKFTQTITEVLNRLIEECVAILGEAPCGFCVLGVGSLARGELCLRSDIDIAFLIDNADYRNSAYFSYVVDALQTKLRCLGESNGICIDEEDIASIKLGKLVHTPESYVATYMAQSTSEQDVVLAYKLLCVKALWSNPKSEPLLERYQQQVAKQLDLGETKAVIPEYKTQGLRYLKMHQSQWQQQQNVLEDKSSAKVDLKKDYLQPLLFWCLDMAIYFGLVEFDKPFVLRHSILNILTELEARHYIHPEFIKVFREAWQTVQQLRADLHHASILHLPSKRRHNLNPDEASLVPTAASHSSTTTVLSQNLSAAQQARLTAIYKHLLEPVYQTLDDFQQSLTSNSAPRTPFDPMYAWFNRQLTHYKAVENVVGPRKPSIDIAMNSVTQVWAETLCQRNASVTEHLASYKRLPDAFKEAYYIIVKRLTPLPALLNSLAAIPFKNGTCLAYTHAQAEWHNFLAQRFTTVEEKTPVKELAKQSPKACLIQWLNQQGELCHGLLHTDFQTAWERAGYLSRHGFDLTRINKAKTSTSKIDGRGYVFPILDSRGNCLAYAKLYPEMPGRQALAESLAWHLSAYGPMSTLCKVTHLATGQVYPLLISQFRGETLQNHLRDGTLTTLESALDKESFTLKFLETLLLSYEDDKFDNIALEPFVNADGKISYRLISFDADRAFAEPFIKEELTEKSILRKQLKINAKSAVYCLEAMKQNLHPQIVIRFKEMQPLTLFTHWLQEPIVTHLMGRLFSQTEAMQFSQNKVHECFIPAAFELGTVSRLYQRFLRIQAALNDAELPQTHLELLSRIEPHLASFYEVVLQQPISAKARFDQLPTHYTFSEEKLEAKEPSDTSAVSSATRSSTALPSPRPLRVQQTTGSTRTRMLNSITIQTAKGDFKRAIAEGTIANPAYVLKAELKPTHDHYRAIQEIRQALINGNSQPFLALSQANYNTDDLKAQILQSLDWSTLKPKPPQTLKQLQEEILNALIGGKYYQLYFTNCIALTNDKLTAIIKDSLELQVLDVSGCIELSATPIRLLATPHSLLHTLNMSHLPRLQYFSHVSLRLGALKREPANALIFPQLRRLNLSDCQNLSVLRLEAPNLQSFMVAGCARLSEFWKSILSVIQSTRVTSIDLRNNELSFEMVQTLAEAFPSNRHPFNLQMDYAPGLPQIWQTLLALWTNNTYLTSVDLLHLYPTYKLTAPPPLKTLATALKHNHTVTSLNCSYNTLDSLDLQALAETLKSNDTLTSLNFSANNLDPQRIQALVKSLENNCTLTLMNLSNNNLGPEGARALAEMLTHNRILTELDLSGNHIGPGGAQTLAEVFKHNHTLIKLSVSNNHLGPRYAQILAEVLRHNHTLRSLNLWGNELGSVGDKALVELLKYNHTLTELNLGQNSLDASIFLALIEDLKNNRTLTLLDLDNNHLGDTGARAIAEILKYNCALTALNLSKNKLYPEGAQALAEAFQHNRTLTELNLSDNEIYPEGAPALATMLKYNRALTRLDLTNNHLGSEGVRILVTELKDDTTLTGLDLSNNHLDPGGSQVLDDIFKYNCTLTSLDLRGNNLGLVDGEALVEMLRYNRTLTSLGSLDSGKLGTEYVSKLYQGLGQNKTLTRFKQNRQKASAQSTQESAETKIVTPSTSTTNTSHETKAEKNHPSRSTFFHSAIPESKEEKRVPLSNTNALPEATDVQAKCLEYEALPGNAPLIENHPTSPCSATQPPSH